MRAVEEGQYAVDFYAQLSTLQAFSVCVAALHGTEASNAIGKERSKQLAHGSSLKALIEEEMQFLIETVTEEEKKRRRKLPRRWKRFSILMCLILPFLRMLGYRLNQIV